MSRKQIAKVTPPTTAKSPSSAKVRHGTRSVSVSALNVGDHVKQADGSYEVVSRIAKSVHKGFVVICYASGAKANLSLESKTHIKK